MSEPRFLISSAFKKALKNSDTSLNNISKKVGFEVKNFTTRNKTISQPYLNKLTAICTLPKLNKLTLNYESNLGKYSQTEKSNKLLESEELAEIIGIILGDGNFCRNRIHISFDKRSRKYIEYVKKLFKKLTAVSLKYNNIKGTNQAYLYCYNKNLSNEFIKFGINRGDKMINQADIPLWIKNNKNYSKNCLRGLIDTDGCIYFSKRDKQRYVKFTNFNRQLLNNFKITAKNLGYKFVSANKQNVCLYRKSEVANFINDVKPFKAAGDIV